MKPFVIARPGSDEALFLNAIMARQLDEMKKYLHKGVQIEALSDSPYIDSTHKSALVLVIEANDPDALKLLMQNGVDINRREPYNGAELDNPSVVIPADLKIDPIMAVMGYYHVKTQEQLHFDMLKILLDAGAQVDEKHVKLARGRWSPLASPSSDDSVKVHNSYTEGLKILNALEDSYAKSKPAVKNINASTSAYQNSIKLGPFAAAIVDSYLNQDNLYQLNQNSKNMNQNSKKSKL